MTRFRRLHGGDRSSSAHFPESACGHACGRAPHSPPATAAPRPTPLRPRPVAAPRPRGPSGRLSSAAAPSRSPAFSLAVSAAVSGVLPSGRAACVLRASPPAPFAPVRRVSRLLRVPSGGVEAGVTHVGHLETRRAQGGGSCPRCWRAARPRRTSGKGPGLPSPDAAPASPSACCDLNPRGFGRWSAVAPELSRLIVLIVSFLLRISDLHCQLPDILWFFGCPVRT